MSVTVQGRRKHAPMHLYSFEEYGSRIGVTTKRVQELVKGGLPTVRDWRDRPATTKIDCKKADSWLSAQGVPHIKHPKGVVYFIREQPTNRIKIGFTENIDRRFREWRSEIAAGGNTASLIGVFDGDRSVEREWLSLAEECECYLGGEWCLPDFEFIAELEVALEQDRARRSAA